jgi:CBS domain-containing protein
MALVAATAGAEHRDTKGSEGSAMKVRDVMTHRVVGVAPSAPIKEAVRLMERHGVSGLPVVDESGAVVGVLSEADLLLKEVGPGGLARRRFGWLLGYTSRSSRAKAEAVTVAEAMSSPAVVIGPDESVRAAARLMVERRVNRLPVVLGDQVIGIVTRADVARTFLRSDAELDDDIRSEVDRCTMGADLGDLHVSVREGVAHVSGHTERRSTAEVLEAVIAHIDGIVACDVRFSWRIDDTQRTQADDAYLIAPWAELR